MKQAGRQIRKQVKERVEKKKRKEELRSIAAKKVKKEQADKVAAKAEAAKKAEADRKKLEADRQKEEKRRREWAEARKRPEEDRAEARKRPEEDRTEARKRPEGEWAEARRRPEVDRTEARKRPEAGRAEARETGAGWEDRHVRERNVQDRLGSRQEGGQGRLSGPEETGLRPDYTIPRRDRSWKTTGAPSRVLPLSYEGYMIAIPRSPKEKLAFQQLLNKKMLFRAPETGPDRCREPHFRFKSGEPTPDSERTDRRRNRSPEGQEAARKRHRNQKD
jgi:hypothetical protein